MTADEERKVSRSAGQAAPAARNWSVWHTIWTGAWLVSLAGMLYGYLSKNALLTGASLFASLAPPPVLVFLEWRAKRHARLAAARGDDTDQPRARS